jgi:hypothetical protein
MCSTSTEAGSRRRPARPLLDRTPAGAADPRLCRTRGRTPAGRAASGCYGSSCAGRGRVAGSINARRQAMHSAHRQTGAPGPRESTDWRDPRKANRDSRARPREDIRSWSRQKAKRRTGASGPRESTDWRDPRKANSETPGQGQGKTYGPGAGKRPRDTQAGRATREHQSASWRKANRQTRDQPRPASPA